MPRDRSTSRHILIRRLLEAHTISSQADLVRHLRDAGHNVTQATVSRDLTGLGAVKVDIGSAQERYAVADRHQPPDRTILALRRAMIDYLVDAIPSGNLVVLKVRAATAAAVAAAVDDAAMAGVIGTVAGDDTVLVIAEERTGGEAVALDLLNLLEE